MLNQLQQLLGNMDVYLIDQLLRDRIQPTMRLLDAGCGEGRNSEYFIRQNFDVWGIDNNPSAISQIKNNLPYWNPQFNPEKFAFADLEHLPFPDQHFQFIFCSAVLHFAKNRKHFVQLFEELIRVLDKDGTLWFRMTTKHSLANLGEQIEEDVYLIPDGSTRYLLDQEVLAALMQKHQLSFVDPFKTVNVMDIRTMATVVLRKEKR